MLEAASAIAGRELTGICSVPTGAAATAEGDKEQPTFRWDLKRPSRGFSSGPSSFFLGAMAATFRVRFVLFLFEAQGLKMHVWSGLPAGTVVAFPPSYLLSFPAAATHQATTDASTRDAPAANAFTYRTVRYRTLSTEELVLYEYEYLYQYSSPGGPAVRIRHHAHIRVHHASRLDMKLML